jgi:hypothetical protein
VESGELLLPPPSRGTSNVDIDDITAIPVKYLSRAWRTEP